MVRFHFRGASGVEHDASASPPHLARIIRRCVDLPGQALFQYVDETSERRTIDLLGVNTHLHMIVGTGFAPKDYRTRAGSVLALDLLRKRAWNPLSEACRQVGGEKAIGA